MIKKNKLFIIITLAIILTVKFIGCQYLKLMNYKEWIESTDNHMPGTLKPIRQYSSG